MNDSTLTSSTTLGKSSALASKMARWFAVRLEGAMNSTCPQAWEDAFSLGAHMRDYGTTISKLTSDDDRQRAYAGMQVVASGLRKSGESGFVRLFGKTPFAMWSEWACDACHEQA